MPAGSAHRMATDLVPEQVILSEKGWDALMGVIEDTYGAYAELDLEVVLQDALYSGDRARAETFGQFIGRVVPKFRELEAALGAAVPPGLLGAILKKQAHLSEVQRATTQTWSRGDLRPETLVGHLRRLDQPNDVLRSTQPPQGGAAKATFFLDREECGPQWEGLGVQLLGTDDPDRVDDDGLPLEADGDTLIPFEKGAEYTEEEAIYLPLYAQSYREVRRTLRVDRNGRGFFKPGGDGRPPYKDNAGGAPNRGKPADMIERVRCYRCGKLGHMSRQCPQRQAAGGSAASSTGTASTTGQMPDGNALVDTGAQDGVAGHAAFEMRREELRKRGLRTREVERPRGRPCAGVGGGAKVLAVEDAPVAMAGACRVVGFAVLEDAPRHEIPILLPVSLLTPIGAVIDPGKMEMDLVAVGCSAKLMATDSGHLVTSLVGFPSTVWAMPADAMIDYEGEGPFVATATVSEAALGKTWYPRDFWKHENDEAIRVHVKPGRVLFAPLGSKGAPECSALVARREMVGRYQDGTAMRRVDSWTSDQGHALMSQPWVGETRFRLAAGAASAAKKHVSWASARTSRYSESRDHSGLSPGRALRCWLHDSVVDEAAAEFYPTGSVAAWRDARAPGAAPATYGHPGGVPSISADHLGGDGLGEMPPEESDNAGVGDG